MLKWSGLDLWHIIFCKVVLVVGYRKLRGVSNFLSIGAGDVVLNKICTSAPRSLVNHYFDVRTPSAHSVISFIDPPPGNYWLSIRVRWWYSVDGQCLQRCRFEHVRRCLSRCTVGAHDIWTTQRVNRGGCKAVVDFVNLDGDVADPRICYLDINANTHDLASAHLGSVRDNILKTFNSTDWQSLDRTIHMTQRQLASMELDNPDNREGKKHVRCGVDRD